MRYVERISRGDANLVTEINRDGYISERAVFAVGKKRGGRENATRSCRVELKRPNSIFGYYTRYVRFLPLSLSLSLFSLVPCEPRVCFHFADKRSELDT